VELIQEMRSTMRMAPIGIRGVLGPNNSPSPQAIKSSVENEDWRGGAEKSLKAADVLCMEALHPATRAIT
jgi:hypothetical protein